MEKKINEKIAEDFYLKGDLVVNDGVFYAAMFKMYKLPEIGPSEEFSEKGGEPDGEEEQEEKPKKAKGARK